MSTANRLAQSRDLASERVSFCTRVPILNAAAFAAFRVGL